MRGRRSGRKTRKSEEEQKQEMCTRGVGGGVEGKGKKEEKDNKKEGGEREK